MSNENKLYPHFLRERKKRDYFYYINRESFTLNLSVLTTYKDIIDYSLNSAQVLIRGRLVNKHLSIVKQLFQLKGLFLILISLLEEPNFLKNSGCKWQGLQNPKGARLVMDKLNFKNKLTEDEKIAKKMDLWVEANAIVEYILKYYKDYETQINNSNNRKLITDIILNKYKLTI